MSIPISNATSSSSAQTSFSILPASSTSDPLFKPTDIEIIEVANQVLQRTKLLREQKIPQMPLGNALHNLSLKLYQLKPNLILYANLIRQDMEASNARTELRTTLNDDQEDLESESSNEEIRPLREKIQATFQALIAEFGKLDLAQSDFQEFWNLNRADGAKQDIFFDFSCEQFLNHCMNRCNYLQKLKVFMQENLSEICSFFNIAGEIDLQQIKFFPQGSETHNRGEVATRVSITTSSKEVLLFVKPRSAKIDQLVIDLFRAINELSAKNKSLDVDLPTYKILNLNWQQEDFSVWQFIDGQHLSGVTAENIIKTFANAEEKKQLSFQLARLESILKRLNISDLHPENLLFTKTTPIQIIPIDLESIQDDAPTGLYTAESNPPSLSSSENALVHQFKRAINDVPHRYVTNPTAEFLGCFTDFFNYPLLVRNAFDNFLNQRLNIMISPAKFGELLLEDIVNKDVPYFQYHNDKITMVHSKQLIAQRQQL